MDMTYNVPVYIPTCKCSSTRHKYIRECMYVCHFQMIDSAPVVAELVQSTSYRCFEQIITSSIGATETGWHQIAMMFRLTQSAIVMAGMGTAVALQIKELTLKYFEDRFANWIVTQGGWV